MSVLVDTNVLLRWIQINHEASSIAGNAVATLLARPERVYYTPQNIVELWNVATRPAEKNGLGLTRDEAAAEVDRFENQLELLPDSPEIYVAWRYLIAKHGVVGTKVHDARLAAVALAYRVTHMLTFNTADFRRFDHIALIRPADV